ncbi:MAG: lactonase family protein [Planctomycetaceae bacterium]|nr:lactonase family protein [Planctomycetaceae bacterium]
MKISALTYAFGLSLGAWLGCIATAAFADDPIVFVSSFAAGKQGAIHAYKLDLKQGSLTLVNRTTGVSNPFFLALSPDRKFMYSIDAEKFGGKEPEQIAAFAVMGRTGQLRPLNRESSRGTASCYLHVDATGKTVVVANYSSGNVASLPIKSDGSLGEPASFIQHTGSSVDPKRQKEPHAHSIVVSPNNRFVYAADLGLDQVLIYKLDASKSTLVANDPPFAKTPAGAGPRHLTFHPNGKQLYVINELLNSVTVFDMNADSGALTEKQTISTLPADFTGTSYCADLKITPNGKFLYGTNRGHDSIAAYSIADNGKLTLIGIEPSLGKGPQNLAITAGGEWLICANMPGKNVAVFAIDAQTGKLKSTGAPVEMASPSCIMLLP